LINIQKEDILIIGGYPPPYGGITVHIKRFHDYCKNENIKLKIISQFTESGHPDIICLTGNKILKILKLIHIIKSFRGRLIHIHSSRLNNLIWGGLLLAWVGRKKIKVITNHSGNFSITSTNSLRNVISRNIYKKFDYIICINRSQQEMFSRVLNMPLSRLPIIPSYIPLANINFIHSKKIELFVDDIYKKVKYLIVTTGYIEQYYGYEIIINAIERIDLNIGVLFIFYTSSNINYKKKLFNKINQSDYMWCLEGISSDDMMYIIKNASLLVRANTADTYGMVVGDAIQLGTPSIASDVCPRHPGTILFKNGNSDDLSIKIKDTIENLANYKKKLKYINIENNADKLIKFYKLLLRDKL